MNKDVAISLIWSMLSIAVSAFFIFHGAWLLHKSYIESAIFVIAAVTFLYGILSLGALLIAWVKPNNYLRLFTAILIFGFILFQIFITLYLDTLNGLEWLGFIILVIMLSTNWVAVKNVVNYKKYA